MYRHHLSCSLHELLVRVSIHLKFRLFEFEGDAFERAGKRRLMMKSVSLSLSDSQKTFMAWFDAIQVRQSISQCTAGILCARSNV
jgi:hypothetical protein